MRSAKRSPPKDCAFWEKACVYDRARYEHEISEGDGSECVKETIIEKPQAQEPMSSESEEVTEPQAKKPRKKKDPNAPKVGTSIVLLSF